MIKFKDILKESESIFIQRRSKEERLANYLSAINKKIQQYIKDGSKGELDLNGMSVERLPDNLKKVGGNLDLRGTKITKLPSGLEVGGFLDLTNSQIQELPSGLKVGGFLALRNTSIQELPSGLKVGGNLYLRNTPISKEYTQEQLKKMLPNVKGIIYT